MKYTMLEANPLFENIAPGNINTVLTTLGAYTRTYNKNDYVKCTGDLADFIGIVLSGTIHVLQYDFYGNRSITASLEKGSLFAETFACAGVKKLPVDIISFLYPTC